jgi:hypothetical protein
MWNQVKKKLFGYNGFKVVLQSGRRRLSRGDFLDLLATDRDFRTFLTGILKALPTRSFRWETPPISDGSLDKNFEFVVVDAPELEVPADLHTFADYFASMPAGSVGDFPNLGGDAQLIVPSPLDNRSSYNHLAAFLNSAPESQVDALWEATANVARRFIGPEPRWLNTAGAGVAWLHIRLDRRPKYYNYRPYRDPDA